MNNIEKLAERNPIQQDAITVKLIDFFGIPTKFETPSMFIEALEGFSILQKTRALQSTEPVAKQPWPSHNWCVGCDPDNCSGCGTEPNERRKQASVPLEKYNKLLDALMSIRTSLYNVDSAEALTAMHGILYDKAQQAIVEAEGKEG